MNEQMSSCRQLKYTIKERNNSTNITQAETTTKAKKKELKTGRTGEQEMDGVVNGDGEKDVCLFILHALSLLLASEKNGLYILFLG